jgi:hypothetical protein
LDYGAGLVESPVVDSANGLVYVFSSSDGTTACAAAAPCAAVYQLSTGFGSGATGTKVTAGNSSAGPHAMYLGAFDSTYYNSASPPTGNLYVCGQTGQNPTLYQIPITAGALPAASTAVALNAASSTAACSPVSDIPNPSSAGGSEERLFLSVASNGRPTGCAGAGAGCLISFVDTPWVASTSYVVGQEILSTTQHIETVITAGTSGATHPTWTTTAGSIRTDGATLKWMDQGILTAALLAGWAANHTYALHNRITDTNGNVEVITTAGTSGGTTPTWPTTAGATVTDGGATWTNAGALPVAGLHTAGGTTGIIVDNTVGSGTLPGASQVYFGTLANQLCTTSGGTGGCAMQASQAALK